ncbi:MAG TPA: recombinase family protein, partial [Pseudonocardiaceae bacterium]|nr:recombinase family protein [Pseudonocardiaceae bacterium]
SIGVATVRPLIYAYLRAREGASEQEDAQVRRELTAYAQREGFTVAESFVERPWLSGTSALDALIETIEQTGVRDVVVPSLNHFSRAGQHASLEKAVIEKQIGAQIWSLHR